ncbi:MAG: PAS domain S-box protein, partial [Magnetococcales bacterium]|nr:PAS domain S-box protein [Magnetococcales bacterium]
LQMAEIIFQGVSDAIIITDAEGCIIDVNHSFEKIMGYGRDEIVGKKPLMFMSETREASYYYSLWEILSKTLRWSGLLTLRAKSGENNITKLKIVAVENHEKKTTHFIGFFSLVTY